MDQKLIHALQLERAHYKIMHPSPTDAEQAYNEAIKLMNLQIPQRPIIKRYKRLNSYSTEYWTEFMCPCCDTNLDTWYSFCPTCGKKIDWSNKNEEI